MMLLIVTLCASAAMNDCQVFSLGGAETLKQCESIAEIHRAVLGPETNYRINCEPADEQP